MLLQKVRERNDKKRNDKKRNGMGISDDISCGMDTEWDVQYLFLYEVLHGS